MMASKLAHRNVMLVGPAGSLEALFWDVEDHGSAPPLAAVVCHPHPQFGGTMHNKVVYQAAKTLHAAGLPVLRFNFRGAGLSHGAYDEGRGEQDDVRAALDWIAERYPGAPLLVAGFSFGAWVGLRVGADDARVTALVGLGLPAGIFDASYLSSCVKPKLLVSGDHDQYAPREKLEAILKGMDARAKKSTELVFIASGDHFFAGHLDELDRAIASWLARHRVEFLSTKPE